MFIGVKTIIPCPGTEVWKTCKTQGLLPEKVDYTRLIPTSIPEQTYIINKTMSHQKYNNVIVDIQRVAWVVTQVRLNNSVRHFFGLANFKTWWWMWLKHPLIMFKLLVGCKLRDASNSVTAKSRTKLEGK
jgi:hypothetical protein